MSSFRDSLRSSVAGNAASYGYTLTIFSTGSVASYMIGKPHLFDVLLFVAGAVIAFLAVEIAVFGRLRVGLAGSTPPEEVWAHAHLLSAGLATLASWAALQVVNSGIGWLIGTALYLLLDAVQSALASRVTR